VPRRLVRAAGAWLLFALVLVVLPALLVRIGWPLPRAIPPVHQVIGALRRPLPDGFTLRLLAVIGWVMWAQLVVAVGAEARGRRRSGPTRRVAPRRLQALVAELVAAATLAAAPAVTTASAAPRLAPATPVVATISATPGAAPAPPVRARSTAVITTSTIVPAARAQERRQPPTSHRARGATAAPAATFHPSTEGPYTVWPGFPAPTAAPAAGISAGDKYVVVTTGDTLWKLGVDHLGDGIRGEQIWALNGGRTMDDGRVFTNAWLIEGGWRLLMPADATGCQVMGAASATATPAPVAKPPTAASTAPAVPTPPSNPAVTSPSAAPTPTGVAVARGSGGAPVPPVRVHGVASSVPGWLLPTGGATLLATFAFLEARRRRARSLRRARSNSVMAPTDPTVDPLLRAVQRAADVGAVERLQAALYHLAMIDRPRLRPQVFLRHPDGRIDLLLFSGSEPVAPWTAAPTNKLFWMLDADAELPEPDPEVVPCPALVQLGVCDDGAELYVDLEGIGILGLNGSPETVRQIARALTATLVVSPAGELCRVLTMGFDPYGLDEQVEDRFVVAKSVEWLLDAAEAGAKEVVEAVAEEKAGSSFRLRALNTDAGWEPTVVVVAGVAMAGDEVARLERLAGDGGLGAAVVCPTARAAWNLELVDPAGGWWELNPLSIRVRPVQMAVDELQDLAAYLADADVEPVESPVDGGRPGGVDDPSVPAGAPLDLPAAPRLDLPAASGNGTAPKPSGNGTAPPGYAERDWKVMICLLGPPYATNRDGVVMGDSGRTAPLQLLAWLVSNRDTATRVGAREALWGGEVVAPKTVTLVFNRAKALLRELAGDPTAEFITRDNDRIRLDPLVVSDYEMVADRIAFARHLDDPAETAEVLAGGLERIRGVPLIGTNWVWADDNHLSSNMAMAASALATDLAALRLQLGQTADAVAATTVGLQVIPGNDELTRLRIQACIDGGDRREAWSVYEEYARRTAARGEDIHPDIVELRNQLTRSGRTQS
jgi:hypothetical protein